MLHSTQACFTSISTQLGVKQARQQYNASTIKGNYRLVKDNRQWYEQGGHLNDKHNGILIAVSLHNNSQNHTTFNTMKTSVW